MLLFSVVSMLVLYIMQRAQALLPFNPQKLAASHLHSRSIQLRRSLRIRIGRTTVAKLP